MVFNMLTNEFLEKWVSVIVPPEYGPNKTPESGYPLLGVYLTSPEKLNVSKTIRKIDSEDKQVFGDITDLGSLMEFVGKDGNRLKNKFVIRICNSISESSAVFTLAHEVGHLKGYLENSVEHEEDSGAYADSYAFERIKEVVEDSNLRTTIFMKSILNFNEEKR